MEKIKTQDISKRFLAGYEKKHLRMDITDLLSIPLRLRAKNVFW